MNIIDVQGVEKSNIKCDNPICDFKEEVNFEDYKEWVNKPCPKCGANLLTQKDFDSFMNLLKTIDFINNIGNKLPKPIQEYLEKKSSRSGLKKMRVAGNGTGDGKLIIEEIKNDNSMDQEI